MSRVLVTGGNGYLGTQVIAALLRQGREVRTTVRSVNSAPEIREALHRSGADDNGLEVVTADLTSDDGWATATAGVEEVHHVASPIPPAQPEDPDELIIPARQGTLRVLRAAREAGARRVVLTSSFAAVGYSPKPVRDCTEDDWTDPDTPGLPPYPRSKTIAEPRRLGLHRAAPRRHRAGRAQPDVYHRPHPGHLAALFPGRHQGDCRGHHAGVAAPAFRRGRRA